MESAFVLESMKAAVQQNKINWIDVSVMLGELSKALRCRQCNVSNLLINVIEYNLQIAAVYDIPMTRAWNEWQIKALAKKYTSL